MISSFNKTMIMYRIFLVAFVCTIAACASSKNENPHVVIETKFGDIEVELYLKQAPKTIAAFLSYIDSGYYKNAAFYRVLRADEQPTNANKSELIQGGIWQTDYKLSAKIPGIPHETTQQTKILHKNGTISLARMEPGTANTEFFICVGDQPGFDYGGANNPDGQGYAAFGKVVKGMPVVKSIYDAPETDGELEPLVYINKIKKL
jgi:peptidyl-prolyl cis-trans isomerase A (cyclophilin A)